VCRRLHTAFSSLIFVNLTAVITALISDVGVCGIRSCNHILAVELFLPCPSGGFVHFYWIFMIRITTKVRSRLRVRHGSDRQRPSCGGGGIITHLVEVIRLCAAAYRNPQNHWLMLFHLSLPTML